MRARLWLAFFAACGVTGVAVAVAVAVAADAVPIKKDQTISQARTALLRAGWSLAPLFRDITPAEQKRLDIVLTGNDMELYRHGFQEIEYCSGIGFNYCFFNYKKGAQCLRVGTKGEFHASPRKEPVVLNWSNECPQVRRP